jgi:hypothetical protein
LAEQSATLTAVNKLKRIAKSRHPNTNLSNNTTPMKKSVKTLALKTTKVVSLSKNAAQAVIGGGGVMLEKRLTRAC